MLSARSSDSGLLIASLPVVSVWPTMRTSAFGLLRRPSAKRSRMGAEVGLDVGAAGGERDVARDVQLELVVRGLRHGHTGALGSGLHFLLLASPWCCDQM